MKLKITDLWSKKYTSLSQLARAMGISVSEICRVRNGSRSINEKFILGAVKAFPGYKLDDLFYVEDETRGRTGQIMMLLEHPDMSYQQIGDTVGCSRQWVHYVARRAGLTRKVKRHLRSDITVERVLELYHEGLLIKHIAKALSCKPGTVTKRLRAAGISKSECYSRGKKLQHHSDVTMERVVQLYHQGILGKDIRQVLGCRPATVSRGLRLAGISESECRSRGMELAWRGRTSRVPGAVGKE